jgi:hypothetical protein
LFYRFQLLNYKFLTWDFFPFDFCNYKLTERAEVDSSREKIEALAGIICGAGDQAAAALLILMGTLQNSSEPTVLANTAKHFTFTRCGELNAYGMVETQIAALESELLTWVEFALHEESVFADSA